MHSIDIQQADALAPLIGRDFLTWLWYFSEVNKGSFQNSQGEFLSVSMEQRIAVLGGEGPSLDTAVSSGPASELREAKLGLQTGKKVNQAKIRIEQDEHAWQIQVKAEDFSLTGLKTPKVDMRLEEGEDPDARFLEKMFLLEKSLLVLDELFHRFLGLRFSGHWSQELSGMKDWVAS